MAGFGCPFGPLRSTCDLPWAGLGETTWSVKGSSDIVTRSRPKRDPSSRQVTCLGSENLASPIVIWAAAEGLEKSRVPAPHPIRGTSRRRRRSSRSRGRGPVWAEPSETGVRSGSGGGGPPLSGLRSRRRAPRGRGAVLPVRPGTSVGGDRRRSRTCPLRRRAQGREELFYLFDLVQATASTVAVFPSPRPQFLEEGDVLRSPGRGGLSRAPAPVGGPKAPTVLAPAAGPRFSTGIVLPDGVLACLRNFLVPDLRPSLPNPVLEARSPEDHGLASSGPRVPLDRRGYLRILAWENSGKPHGRQNHTPPRGDRPRPPLEDPDGIPPPVRTLPPSEGASGPRDSVARVLDVETPPSGTWQGETSPSSG